MHGYTTLTTGQPAASGERSDPYWLNDPTDPLCAPAVIRLLRYLTSKGRFPVAVRVEDRLATSRSSRFARPCTAVSGVRLARH